MKKNQLETRVLERLGELGISKTMLEENRDKDGRSPIIGTYRILMYRMGTDNPEMELKLDDPSSAPAVNPVSDGVSNPGATRTPSKGCFYFA